MKKTDVEGQDQCADAGVEKVAARIPRQILKAAVLADLQTLNAPPHQTPLMREFIPGIVT